jgi:hypothetical protein
MQVSSARAAEGRVAIDVSNRLAQKQMLFLSDE